MARELTASPASLFDRTICRSRPLWVKLSISLTLLFLPFLAAYLDGRLNEFFQEGYWRFFLLAPSIIIYIWLLSPLMIRSGTEAVNALQRLSSLDAESFEHLVKKTSQINPRFEIIAFGIGAILGIAAAQASGFDLNASWLTVYLFLSTALMYGLLAWTISISIVGTRENAALYRLPLRIDILNPSQFEAVGRHSLLLALVFIGGITLSLLLTYQPDNLTSPDFWLGYLLLVIFTVLIFFLNMQPTHRVLADTKKRELTPVQQRIQEACRELLQRLEQKETAGDLAAEVNALVTYEQRLLAARTWPYNTAMLRTLFFSVLIPLGSVLARLMVEVVFR